MLSKVKLYGELADFCGGQNQFEAVINQPIDAVRFLKANFAGLEKHMSSQFYKVYVGEHNIDEELLDFPSGGLDIKIIPVVTGAGNVGKIIAGVALIGLGMITGQMGFISLLKEPVLASGSIQWFALSGKIGMLLVLSGVACLLTPTP